MNIVLISPYADTTSMSIRLLSACLKRAGHSVKQIFLRDLDSLINHGMDFTALYSDSVEEQVIDLCSGADLIGISLMTNYFFKIRHLTKNIRDRTGVPVVWGGAHPTVAPGECLKETDFVCVGEGEGAILDLVDVLSRGDSPGEIKNIWYAAQGKIHRNPVRPPMYDLDSLPFPDYELNDDYLLVHNDIVPFSENLLMEMSRGHVNFTGENNIVYETIWTRGCPYHCTYCINNALIALYDGHRTLRRRSVDHLIRELAYIRQKFPWYNRINFQDDSFMHVSIEELRKFAFRYRDEIGFPFFCLCSVTSVEEEKLRLLFDSGLKRIQMGIQSVAESTNVLYRRTFLNSSNVKKSAQLIRRIMPQDVIPTYDVILDNPYENTRSALETLETILQLPKPFFLQLFSLTFFPGTELYEKALADGTIKGSQNNYMKEQLHFSFSYLNILFTMVNRSWFPRWLLRLLSWAPLVLFMESPPVHCLFSLLNRPYWFVRLKRSRKYFRYNMQN